jgi:hypothetical protein
MWADSPFAAFFAAEQTNRLKLTPTRFELSDDERKYWQALQEAQVGFTLGGATRTLRSDTCTRRANVACAPWLT